MVGRQVAGEGHVTDSWGIGGVQVERGGVGGVRQVSHGEERVDRSAGKLFKTV